MFRLDCGGKVLATRLSLRIENKAASRSTLPRSQTMTLAYVTPDDDAFLVKDR